MNNRIKMGRLCVCLLAMLACADLHAMMEADKFIGAWRLVSAEFRAEDGAIAESPYGPEPQGLLMYDAHGSMAAQLAQTGRKLFAVADRMAARPGKSKRHSRAIKPTMDATKLTSGSTSSRIR